MIRLFLLVAFACAVRCCYAAEPATVKPVAPKVAGLLRTYCGDCHVGDASEGDFSLLIDENDWSSDETILHWEHVHEMLSRGIMPPVDSEQSSESERKEILDWVDKALVQNSPIGGTLLRRLNRREYAATIQSLFSLNGYAVPQSFPPDNTVDGFDTQAEALVVAGSHLEALSETASDVADRLFPPPEKPVLPKKFDVPANELVISYSSACLIDGAMRLASSGKNVVRNATWPTKFEAPVSGIYELELDLSAFNPPGQTPVVTVATMRMSDRGDLQTVTEIEVGNSVAKTTKIEVDIQKGHTIVLRYLNGPFDYEDQDKYRHFLTELFTEDQKLAAAWKKIGKPARGGSGWERVQELMQDSSLDATEMKTEKAIADLVKHVSADKVASGETLVYKYFEEGPNIGIHGLRLRGPIRTISDKEQLRRQGMRSRFLGAGFDGSERSSVEAFFGRFLSEAFRRPATGAEVESYANLVERESSKTGSIDQGLHLAVRTALLSPAFLYRGFGQGELDDYELATRLSYFLKAQPPDERLRKTISSGKLSSSATLGAETKRLISKKFAEEFCQQWLGTSAVKTLMPDMRLNARFSPRHRSTAMKEVSETFWHIWSKNLPVTEFIRPDFVFTDYEVGRDMYALPRFMKKQKLSKKERNTIIRVQVPRDGRQGGLLSMPAVMIATANGVDTQPVLRGVWVLDNILGMPPPEPPDAVPALTPDTASATTVKERLLAHMNEQSCAVCHREIDPLGFVLENYDPVGRWREHYPKYETASDGSTVMRKGQAVENAGMLPDGTVLNDVRDLKKWLAEHPEYFARCISEKLLTYATGRRLNYRERKIISDIVDQEKESGLRFRDLVLALVDSKIFRYK